MFAEVITNKYSSVFFLWRHLRQINITLLTLVRQIVECLEFVGEFPNLASVNKCGNPSPIWGVKIEWDKLQIKMRGRYWTQQNGLFLNDSILRGRLQLGLTILFNVLRRGRWVLGINFKPICNWGKLIENRLTLVQASDYIHLVVDEMKCKKVW